MAQLDQALTSHLMDPGDGAHPHQTQGGIGLPWCPWSTRAPDLVDDAHGCGDVLLLEFTMLVTVGWAGNTPRCSPCGGARLLGDLVAYVLRLLCIDGGHKT